MIRIAPYTPAAENVVRHAQSEAHRLGYPFIQREQLFLGLLQEDRVSRILSALGLDVQSTREAIEAQVMPGLGAPDDPTAIGLLPTAEQVYRQRAHTAAAVLGHTHVGPEHILLGFMLEQHGVVVDVLSGLGVTKEKLMDAISHVDR